MEATENEAKSLKFCLFCCKSSQNVESSLLSPNSEMEKLQRFLATLGRFLQNSKTLHQIQTRIQALGGSPSVCSDCSSVVKTTCDLYHEIKCAELQIQLKLDSLLRVMRTANRIHSRIDLIKQTMGDTWENFMQSRMNFIRFCTKGISQFYPKVALTKEIPMTLSKTEPVENSADVCNRWVMSLIALAFLVLQNPATEMDVTYSVQDCGYILDDDFYSDSGNHSKTNNHETAQLANFQGSATNPESPSTPVAVESTSITDDDDFCHDGNHFETDKHETNHLATLIANLDTETSLLQVESAPATDDNDMISNDDDFEMEDVPQALETKPKEEIGNTEEEMKVDETDTCSEVSETSSDESSTTNDDAEIHTPSSNEDLAPLIKEEPRDATAVNTPNHEEVVNETQVEIKMQQNSSVKESVSILTFVCSYCPRKLLNKSALSRHLYSNHPKENLIATPRPYFCKLCKRGYLNYPQYVTHRKTFMHIQRLKSKQSKSNSAFKDDILMENSAQRLESIEQEVPLKSLSSPTALPAASSSHLQNSEISDHFKSKTIENDTVNNKSATTAPSPPQERYQLRKKRKVSVTRTSDTDEGTDTSSSDNTDNYENDSDTDSVLDESSTSASSIFSDEEDIFENLTIREKGKKRLRKRSIPCSFLGCRYKAGGDVTLKEHLKLHEPGNYSCNFCRSTHTTPLDIAMHEMEQHSEMSKKNRKQQNNRRVIFCSRCPYQTIQKSSYTNHFAYFHLGISRTAVEQCSICKVEILIKCQRRHFEKCHDTTKVAPEKVLKCKESNCTAYFTSKWGLRQHKLEVHKELKERRCGKCGKLFRFIAHLQLHKERFHNSSKSEVSKTRFGALICIHINCTKSFASMLDMEKHLTLHGNFKCDLCEVEKDFAPDLAMHELEHGNKFNLNQFTCQRCLFRTNSVESYKTHHLETHLGIRYDVYDCSVCKKRYTTGNGLKNHLKSNHGDGTVDLEIRKKCDKCSAYFLKEEQLETHQSNQHSESTTSGSVLKCNISNCTEIFTNVTDRNTHQKLHADFSCQICNVHKEYAEDLATHELEHRKQNRKGKKIRYVKCSRCKYSTSTSEPLKEYVSHFIEIHLSTKLNQCTVCQASLANAYSLLKHMKRMHRTDGVDPSKIHRCDQCSVYFLKDTQLLFHKRLVHSGIDAKNLKCLVCGKSFKSNGALRNHHRIKHGIGKSNEAFDFACDVQKCDKRFQTKDELDWHKKFSVALFHERGSENHIQWKKPTPKELIPCKQCGKAFMGVSKLKMHITKIHRPDRLTEFKCDQCDKVFKQKAQLQMHQEYHKPPEEWKFMCSICSKKCVTKATLDSHMGTHTKEKPYVCQVCGEKYAHRHNLRNHVNSKHKDEGVQDIPKNIKKRFYVCRKGKKLGQQYCFTREESADQN